MKILDGKKVAGVIKNTVRWWVQNIINETGSCDIKLVVIQVGNNSASHTYIRNKQKACDYVGINMVTHYFDDDVSQQTLIEFIQSLNEDDSVNGILVQMPLPKHLDADAIVNIIDPMKDVDGFTAVNAGRLARHYTHVDCLMPCTPCGIIELIEYYGINVAGKHCVVVGRSNIVGKPMAEMLLMHDATVTVCHSHTENLKDVCKSADILICAIGNPKFFTQEYVKDGAVVIDVGMNRDENGKLCGDVDFDNVKDVASAITPTPGGTGPLTVAILTHNCFSAYLMQHENRKNM